MSWRNERESRKPTAVLNGTQLPESMGTLRFLSHLRRWPERTLPKGSLRNMTEGAAGRLLPRLRGSTCESCFCQHFAEKQQPDRTPPVLLQDMRIELVFKNLFQGVASTAHAFSGAEHAHVIYLMPSPQSHPCPVSFRRRK